MAIERYKNEYLMTCDRCPDNFEDDRLHHTFEEVLEAGKRHGWRAVRAAGEWLHLCGECFAKHEADR